MEKKNINLHLYIDNDVPDNLRGDPKRLRQVLVNLISNAHKFTEKGEITIIVQNDELSQNNVSLKFSVSDTGTGIFPEKIKSIFQSFAQGDTSTTRKFGGSGLGLTISKHLCELMEGEIWVESPAKVIFPNGTDILESTSKNEGHGPGSSFHFTAKFYIHEEGKRKQKSKTPPANLNILCLDIDPITSIVITQILKKYKYRVNILPWEAKLSEELSKTNYDVVFVNHQTSNLDINLLINEIRKDRDTPFIILTTLSEEKNLSDLKIKENIWSIIKPIKHNVLINTLINMLNPSKGRVFKRVENANKEIEKLKTLKDSVKILLAEDNHINQRVATALIAKTGVPVEIADDGAIAVKMLKEKKYDLVLMDIAMPNMDGITATENIRKVLGLDIPIIALTAQAIGDSDDCFAAGMNDYITKPVQPKILYKTLLKWLMAEQKLKKVINKA